ncbi:MAG TPA: hypothetical protein VGT03_06965 [Candidatus Acidoferrales bacterium]|nr:hypothetical protein [Candidatus Acidoferrales bacterium]
MKLLLAFAAILLAISFCLAAAPSAVAQVAGQGPGGNWPRQPSLGPGGVAGEVHDVNAPKDPSVISAETVLSANPNLAAKLQALLPANLPVLTAASGYPRLENFATALHATHDLGIPFADFKCAELGGKFCAPETKARGRGFGKALETLKPELPKPALKAAEKKAKDEAKNDAP